MSGRQPRPTAYTYRDAGVDNTGGSRAKERIGEFVRETFTADVLGDFGHFGSMFRSPGSDDVVLVSSADSVGTKVLLAVLAGRHESIGVDLVNHCVNDILCCGARPLFFLDYFATSKLDDSVLEALVEGMAEACQQAGCALIGGETAQLPGIYQPGTYDLAGFIVGSVKKDDIIDGSEIEHGQSIIGLASNGLHTNGYSLARAVFGLEASECENASEGLWKHYPELAESLGDALLRPHISYLDSVLTLREIERPAGLAHVTGGGIAGNLERVIPDNCTAVIDPSRWPIPPIFDLIQGTGNVETAEMYRVFNMGIGFIAVTSPESAKRFCDGNQGTFVIGEIQSSSDKGASRVEIQGIDAG